MSERIGGGELQGPSHRIDVIRTTRGFVAWAPRKLPNNMRITSPDMGADAGRDGQVPAFVLDEVDGYTVLRYMMAAGAPDKSAPTGRGDGAFEPFSGAEAVVAVVGSAHVRGMCRRWDATIASSSLSVQDLCKS
jgi:hypothetical protein